MPNNKTKKHRTIQYVFKISTIIIICGLIVLLLPKIEGFKYSYQKGMPWKYETLIAPLDFPLHKSAEELAADIEKIKEKGISGISSVGEDDTNIVVDTIYDGTVKFPKYEVMAERCLSCKSKKVVIYDELIGENGEVNEDCNRFDLVAKLEAMTPDERFAFWQNELSKCIRCNACRNVCPACTCEKCVFDNDNSGVAQKAAANSFEENMFHIIRAFHVAGRCTDCGECSRVCPQHIPLHLLNRKFIKDANELYGEYQAGADMETKPPLVNFTYDDCEPSVVYERGGAE